jgi:phosphotriesterase-related protein
MTGRSIRTLFEDVGADDLGFTLAHEHLACAFDGAAGDPDLKFLDVDAVVVDVKQAVAAGIRSVVEVSTYEMQPRLDLIGSIARRTGIHVVKSTGWRMSPAMDALVGDRAPETLARRLIDDLTTGFESGGRAGLIGEIGMSGRKGTARERTVLAAVALATVETNAAVSLHTEGAVNMSSMVDVLVGHGVAPDRILAGHARADNSLLDQRRLAEAGVVLGFDQLGHPRYDSARSVAVRIVELAAHGLADRIVLSADVGRLSRLTSYGGSGYVSGVREVCGLLGAEGMDERTIDALIRGNIARLLAMPARPGIREATGSSPSVTGAAAS